jgi:two-component system, OmpR family, phosphate regulon sensor histidine kinase PhoR
MRLRTKVLLAIVLTVLAGDVLGTLVVQDRLSNGAQREAMNQAQARARQVHALYAERAATLQAESEAISLYPAVITALIDNNPAPLLRWSNQVANLQGTSVTVTDATGRVVARGHAPDQSGDNLSDHLTGLRLALAGDKASGTEAGDELGLAVRGYAPVRRDGVAGPIVGAVMIADPADDRFLSRLGGATHDELQLRVDLAAPDAAARMCAMPVGLTATCKLLLTAPDGSPSGGLALDVPLGEVERAQIEAQRGLWLASLIVLLVSTAAAWVLARSLTGPLARLTAASQRIGAGNLGEPVQVRTGDEIGTLGNAFERMRRQLAEMTGRLRNERDVLDSVLESAGDGILMVDSSGRRVVSNGAWSTLTGGDDLAAAAHLRRADGRDGDFATACDSWLADPVLVATADFDGPDPHQRFRTYSAPVRQHPTGDVLGRIFVLRDVTREAEAERMRAALVASVSHELRSPLTSISGYTDTLLHHGPWDDTIQHEFLEAVAGSAARLTALVDNLLDAATLEAGALRLQREPVRVERVAERVLAQRRLLAGACTLRLDTRPGLPLAEADPLRIEQVIANLVDNAIKYSPHGGEIRVRVEANTGDELVVTVADQGQGVPPQHVQHLFERFYRVDAEGRRVKGVGLGLYICKSLVESHGGRIWVDSEPERGSTFAFTLPTLAEGIDEHAPLPSGQVADQQLVARSRV